MLGTERFSVCLQFVITGNMSIKMLVIKQKDVKLYVQYGYKIYLEKKTRSKSKYCLDSLLLFDACLL